MNRPECCIGCPAMLRHDCRLQAICTRVKIHNARQNDRIYRGYINDIHLRILRKNYKK